MMTFSEFQQLLAWITQAERATFDAKWRERARLAGITELDAIKETERQVLAGEMIIDGQVLSEEEKRIVLFGLKLMKLKRIADRALRNQNRGA